MYSCSKSDDTPEAKVTVKAGYTFSKTQVWPSRYKIMFGAFGKDTLNPQVYAEVSNPGENILFPVVLNDVTESAALVKLYIANTAKQPVFTLSRKEITVSSATVELPNETIDLLSYPRVQSQVFSSCVACHGGSSGLPAAGLNLTPADSYSNIVNKASTHSSKNRIKPGSVAESFLVDVLKNQQTGFVHSASNTIAEEDVLLIEKWIEAGALNQ